MLIAIPLLVVDQEHHFPKIRKAFIFMISRVSGNVKDLLKTIILESGGAKLLKCHQEKPHPFSAILFFPKHSLISWKDAC